MHKKKQNNVFIVLKHFNNTDYKHQQKFICMNKYWRLQEPHSLRKIWSSQKQILEQENPFLEQEN